MNSALKKLSLAAAFSMALPLTPALAQEAPPREEFSYVGNDEGTSCTSDKQHTISYTTQYAVSKQDLAAKNLTLDAFKKQYFTDISARMKTAWTTVTGHYTIPQLMKEPGALAKMEAEMNGLQRSTFDKFESETGITVRTNTFGTGTTPGCDA